MLSVQAGGPEQMRVARQAYSRPTTASWLRTTRGRVAHPRRLLLRLHHLHLRRRRPRRQLPLLREPSKRRKKARS